MLNNRPQLEPIGTIPPAEAACYDAFTLSAKAAWLDPMVRNGVMGTYTYFVNPMDLCAVAVPGAPARAGLPSSLSFIGLAGRDSVVAGLALQFQRQV